MSNFFSDLAEKAPKSRFLKFLNHLNAKNTLNICHAYNGQIWTDSYAMSLQAIA